MAAKVPLRVEFPGLTDKAYQWFLKLFKPTWTKVSSFSNSWVNYGGGYVNAQYCKNSFGLVTLKGLIKDGTINAVAFQLPLGFRPPEILDFAVASSGSYGVLTIDVNGEVYPKSPGTNTFFWLTGAAFYTE